MLEFIIILPYLTIVVAGLLASGVYLHVFPLPEWFPRREVLIGPMDPSEVLLMAITATGAKPSLWWHDYEGRWRCRIEFKRMGGNVEIRSNAHELPRAAVHEAYSTWKEFANVER